MKERVKDALWILILVAIAAIYVVSVYFFVMYLLNPDAVDSWLDIIIVGVLFDIVVHNFVTFLFIGAILILALALYVQDLIRKLRGKDTETPDETD